MKKILPALFLLSTVALLQVSCSKPSTDELQDPGTPPAALSDSVFILTNIRGSIQQGDEFDFEYNSDHNVTRFIRPYGWAQNTPCTVYYTNGKPSSVIYQCKNINNNTIKSSMILVYGSNSKCTKVLYKKPLANNPDNGLPYFTDVTDGNLHSEYDSLTYSATNQLQAIYRMNNNGVSSTAYNLVKFFYPSPADTVANRLEEYTFDANGNPSLYDQLLITTNNMESPVYRQFWFFPFVNKLSYIVNTDVMSLPLLYNGPSTNLNIYLPLIQKCITHYEVYNNWGMYNYHTSFDYTLSSDSTTLRVTMPGNPIEKVDYYFSKEKR